MKDIKIAAPLQQNIQYFLKWTLISVLIGVTVGGAGTLFGDGLIVV